MKNREIKYKVWDSKNESMEEVCAMHYFIDFGGRGYEVEMNNNRESILCPANDDSKYDQGVLLQYTGIKDKNGVEIWEGDRVRVFSKEYQKGGGKATEENIFNVSITLSGVRFSTYPYNRFKSAEVIGNIYENPELI